MVNKNLFKSNRSVHRGHCHIVPQVDAVNAAGGIAYNFPAESALAQYAVTGTFQDTYYVGAADHLQKVEVLATGCGSQFIAKLAVYSAETAKMKDMPVYLLAVLASRGETELVKLVFPRVCKTSKMLLN